MIAKYSTIWKVLVRPSSGPTGAGPIDTPHPQGHSYLVSLRVAPSPFFFAIGLYSFPRSSVGLPALPLLRHFAGLLPECRKGSPLHGGDRCNERKTLSSKELGEPFGVRKLAYALTE